MAEGYRVKETTKQKDNGERPQESIDTVIKSYKDKNKFDGNIIKDGIRLKKEPNGEIKVLLKSVKGKQYHIGYVEKASLEALKKEMRNAARFDAKLIEHTYDRTALDENNNVYVVDQRTINEVYILPIDIVEATKNNPLLKEGDGSTKTKVMNRIGCGLMLFIVLMIIIIIFT